jgi:hypothetical protein
MEPTVSLGQRLLALAVPAAVAAVVALLLSPLVEALKLRFVRKSWAAQERWRLKVSVYERMLPALEELERLAEPDYSSVPPVYGGLTEDGKTMFWEAYRQLKQANALGQIWLPDAVTKANRKVQTAATYADPSDFFRDVHEASMEAKKQLLEAVHRDLKL